MVRILEKNIPVRVELNIQATFYPEAAGTPNGINILAEIPGSDLADEVVIMGAHFDTTPGATGATDNATGSAAMMEAVRVIKSLGLRPRRTIRVALWGGEEQGLLGSRAYVAEHYGTETAPSPHMPTSRRTTTSTTAPAKFAASGDRATLERWRCFASGSNRSRIWVSS